MGEWEALRRRKTTFKPQNGDGVDLHRDKPWVSLEAHILTPNLLVQLIKPMSRQASARLLVDWWWYKGADRMTVHYSVICAWATGVQYCLCCSSVGFRPNPQCLLRAQAFLRVTKSIGIPPHWHNDNFIYIWFAFYCLSQQQKHKFTLAIQTNKTIERACRLWQIFWYHLDFLSKNTKHKPRNC